MKLKNDFFVFFDKKGVIFIKKNARACVCKILFVPLQSH